VVAKLRRDAGEAHAVPAAASAEDDAGYDAARQLVAASARGSAADRQPTEEELVELERQRLERLEKQRKMRMAAEEGEGPTEVDEEGVLAAGGFARRRALARKAQV
jgi:nucleolar protein 14